MMTTERKRQGVRDARIVIQELLADPRLMELLLGDVMLDRDRLQNAWEALGQVNHLIKERAKDPLSGPE